MVALSCYFHILVYRAAKQAQSGSWTFPLSLISQTCRPRTHIRAWYTNISLNGMSCTRDHIKSQISFVHEKVPIWLRTTCPYSSHLSCLRCNVLCHNITSANVKIHMTFVKLHARTWPMGESVIVWVVFSLHAWSSSPCLAPAGADLQLKCVIADPGSQHGCTSVAPSGQTSWCTSIVYDVLCVIQPWCHVEVKAVGRKRRGKEMTGRWAHDAMFGRMTRCKPARPEEHHKPGGGDSQFAPGGKKTDLEISFFSTNPTCSKKSDLTIFLFFWKHKFDAPLVGKKLSESGCPESGVVLLQPRTLC